ncbi:MAG TPA: GDSL-type esterase/lipase family protein [Opitutaceae bacterium]|nr:GDSL-type esterase/lipase family protein [Opitutaceae bacterium]
MNKHHGLPRLLACLTFPILLTVAVAQTSAPATKSAQPATPSTPPAKVDASAPIQKQNNARFLELHESFLQRAKSGPIDLLFLGDSITEGWKKAPHIWEHYYGKLQPANFGIGGDQTQHVIWRIENGELDGIHPKVVVLMLGTNNTASHTAEEIAAADKKIVELIRAKIPSTKVLVLAVFPRGARKNKEGVITPEAIAEASRRMAVIDALNPMLAKLDDGVNVRFLNINERFLGQDGKIPFPIMPDQLHPTAAGYQLWAEAMQPLLDEMLNPPAAKQSSATDTPSTKAPAAASAH